jgi:hypothetical protein
MDEDGEAIKLNKIKRIQYTNNVSTRLGNQADELVDRNPSSLRPGAEKDNPIGIESDVNDLGLHGDGEG